MDTKEVLAETLFAASALPPKALLSPEEIIGDRKYGGLVVIGSYVPTSTRQLEHLRSNTDLQAVELKVQELLNAGPDREQSVSHYGNIINASIRGGQDTVLYTSRELITAATPEDNLAIGTKISEFLTDIVGQLAQRPKYLIAKGGITSSEIATKSLNIKRAMVKGQILPGVPVWTCGEESKFRGLAYIIFPGDVGETDSMTRIVQDLG